MCRLPPSLSFLLTSDYDSREEISNWPSSTIIGNSQCSWATCKHTSSAVRQLAIDAISAVAFYWYFFPSSPKRLLFEILFGRRFWNNWLQLTKVDATSTETINFLTTFAQTTDITIRSLCICCHLVTNIGRSDEPELLQPGMRWT